MSWTCFFCGEICRTYEEAVIHFGYEPLSRTACEIKAGEEYGLLVALREAEKELLSWREENSEVERDYHGLYSEMLEKVRLAEETGYARALADVKAGKVEPDLAQQIVAALTTEKESQ